MLAKATFLEHVMSPLEEEEEQYYWIMMKFQYWDGKNVSVLKKSKINNA